MNRSRCSLGCGLVTPPPIAELSIVMREKKIIEDKQINDVTIKIINLCGRLKGRKFPSSWPPMLIQIILFYLSVCLSVCVCLSVSDHVFGTKRPIFTNFSCVLTMPVSRSSSGGVVIRCVLPVYGCRHICCVWNVSLHSAPICRSTHGSSSLWVM